MSREKVSPGTMMPMPADRDLALVKLMGRLVKDANDCWNWDGTKDYCGYGHAYIEGRSVIAHRLMYALHFGPIPHGGDMSSKRRFICHHCDNPSCCNPNHLYLGSGADNSRDMVERCRGRIGHRVSYLRGRQWSLDRSEIPTGKVYWAIQGDVRSLHEWAEYYGVNFCTLDQRLSSGWPAMCLGDPPYSYDGRKRKGR